VSAIQAVPVLFPELEQSHKFRCAGYIFQGPRRIQFPQPMDHREEENPTRAEVISLGYWKKPISSYARILAEMMVKDLASDAFVRLFIFKNDELVPALVLC
jgi:hypothetical protein